MIEIQGALAAIKKVDEAVGILARLVSKLKGDPDHEAAKLAEALDEVAKTWRVMDEAVSNYLRLGIDEDALNKGSEVLLKIEGGSLLVTVKQGRGHCHVIGNIFGTYLDRWFQRVLNGKDLDAVRDVFYMLSNADDDVFANMEHMAGQLQTEANGVLSMVAQGNVRDAKAHVLSVRNDLHPFRVATSAAMAKLYDLRAKFIEIAGLT
jgi:hypothetical protein